jgi:HD-GYP domain-containing protein (c-di-GMP phosphodiesterase class II)/DNA-binding CsgD family transcriptional regulator
MRGDCPAMTRFAVSVNHPIRRRMATPMGLGHHGAFANERALRMNDDNIDLLDALRALAFMGDLSMGQPVDHSPRVAWLACQLARAIGLDDEVVEDVRCIALLRWSGCTANATDVAATISDDVVGRGAMLAWQIERIEVLVSPEELALRLTGISAIHCEVSSVIADALGLGASVADALRCVFEHWDGSGQPLGLSGDSIPISALVVSLCSDLEVLARVHGLPSALALLQKRSGVVYPSAMVETVRARAPTWIDELTQGPVWMNTLRAATQPRAASLALVGDVIDLKLPWLLGHSRAVAELADTIGTTLGLAAPTRRTLRRAGWLHGLGRVAVPNAVWNRAGPLSAADWERARLSPYWTSRAAQQIARLEVEAQLASHVCERLDGSGYFRGSRLGGTPLEFRVLPVASAWLALTARRPWREALPDDIAIEHLRKEVVLGRLDGSVVDALAKPTAAFQVTTPGGTESGTMLSPREIEVLRRVSLGESNKEAALRLGISPSTVRTHLESIFRKLDCKSRAAGTLKASVLGLL